MSTSWVLGISTREVGNHQTCRMAASEESHAGVGQHTWLAVFLGTMEEFGKNFLYVGVQKDLTVFIGAHRCRGSSY
jgi:hypothetical protein